MTGSEGQDWAGYQLAKPATAGLSYAFVKATEGTGYVNPKYTSQVATGRAGNLVVGHYHFARPGSVAAQVTYFLAHTSIRPGDTLAFDWEDAGVSSADKDAWIKAVQAAMPGHQVGLYCNRDFWLNRDKGGFYGDFLWIADPSAPKGKPRITSPWLFHQYSEAGGIDRDYSPLTPAQLKAWSHAKENDMAFTPADAETLLDTPIDDPTTADNSKTTLRGMLWTAGRDAGHAAADAAQALDLVQKQTTAPAPAPAVTDAQIQALAAQLVASPTFAAAIATAVVNLEAARLAK